MNALLDWVIAYEEKHEWIPFLVVCLVVLVVLSVIDPQIIAQPWRLFRWFGGGSTGN